MQLFAKCYVLFVMESKKVRHVTESEVC